MKVSYFGDTDTLYIEFRAGDIAETRDLDENTLMDVDADGNVCAVHSSTRASAPTCITSRSRASPRDGTLAGPPSIRTIHATAQRE